MLGLSRNWVLIPQHVGIESFEILNNYYGILFEFKSQTPSSLVDETIKFVRNILEG